MIYCCQALLSTLRSGALVCFGEGGDLPAVYQSCGLELRWNGEHGLSCPDHGPRHIAERLAPSYPGSAVLEPSDVCTV